MDKVEMRVRNKGGEDYGRGNVIVAKGKIGDLHIDTLGRCDFTKLSAGTKGIAAHHRLGALITANAQSGPQTSARLGGVGIISLSIK
jgi:hypothetical protein